MPLKKFNPGSCDWCGDAPECPEQTNPCADTFLTGGMCEGDFDYTPAPAANWSASDSVTTGDRRKATAAVGGFSVGEVILSLSTRTTGSTFDSTEASNWEAEGCVNVRPEYWTLTLPGGWETHPEAGGDIYAEDCGDAPAGTYELSFTGSSYLYLDLPAFAALLLIGSGQASIELTWETDGALTSVAADLQWPWSDFDCMDETLSIGPEYYLSAGEGGSSFCINTLPLIFTRGPLVSV